MNVRDRLVIAAVVVVAMAAMAQSSQLTTELGVLGHGLAIDVVEEVEEAAAVLESEWARRQLRKGQYLSYEALARNNIPCGQRGNTYYECRGHEQANPYNRGCTRATLCKRNTR